jgi:uncharacterized protein GlcG (DUF336 family)
MACVSYERACALTRAAMRHAEEIGSPSSVTIVDEGRNLVAFARHDDAILASIDVSQAKAYTAASLQMATADLAEHVQPGAGLYGLSGGQAGPFVPFGGGRPLMVDGAMVGAVGVSGGTPDQDDEIARAAVDALPEVPA